MPLLALLLLLLLAAAGCATSPPAAPRRLPSAPPRSAIPPKPLAPGREKVRVPHSASGRYAVVRGGAPARRGRGEVVRYLVEVERGLPFDPAEFAAEVHRTLNDVRGWGRFERVDRGPVRVRVALSSPGLTIRQCLPLRTGGELSCWNGRRSVINALRWAEGVPQYGGDLTAYRRYLISHEVGHGLGHHHRRCPGPGRPAPVMVQQSKSLGRCRPNPWPFPHRGPDKR
ncbi:hypothetical protein BKM31_24530 [[Actinomadura] parvosata subsp. kistnae]|uniref:DUF3152 domain-containing protein n=1 Tax=[Actinomadura] parvosata subsp. kistnae TaxID=1909395 RepID=A0A1V0A1Y5_9ACTN|nr:DUF3152 domain-containing protein [Nonomuraea sp. ATCC 55076]AQZ64208.1 hypothetical protein BKM31_24530 [Nonomuraea sp. ATCC 55076]